MTPNERFLLNLVRRRTPFRNFTLSISADGDTWSARLEDHDTGAVIGDAAETTFEAAMALCAPGKRDRPS
jgi:hypothetical protein